MKNALQILLEVSLYSSAIIIVVFALGKLFSGKISAKLVYVLWLLVLLRLLLPVTFQSPVNVPYPDFVGKTLEAPPEAEPLAPGLPGIAFTGSTENEHISYPPTENAAESAPAANTPFKLDIKAVIIALWLAGAAFFLVTNLYKIAAYYRKIGKIKKESPVYGARMETAKNELGIKKTIRVAESKYADMPLVFGTLRPVILFPEGFAETIGGKKLSYIMLHELCHVKRRDLLINHIWLLARALHWFNPLVHIAYKSYLDTVEEACDEMVINQLKNHEKYEYSQSLLDVARIANGSRKPLLSVSLIRSNTAIRKRVMKMMHPKKKSRTFTFAAILIACVMCFACFTTACQPVQAADDTDLMNGTGNEAVGGAIAEAGPTPVPEAHENLSVSHSEPDKPTEEKTASYDPEMTEDEAIQIIAQLGLDEVKSIEFTDRKDYFGDSLANFDCRDGEAPVFYTFLESIRSLVTFEDKNVDMTVPIELSDEQFKSIALDYAKKLMGSEEIEFTLCEAATLGPDGDFYYFGADGVIGETGRKFAITLNGKGEIRGFSSYPTEVDLEKGVSIDEARQNALALLREQAHITDENNLTVISETLSTDYSPAFVFNFEYRSDSPTAEEYDYDSCVRILAATGELASISVTPITSNIEVYSIEEAEQMAKEYIAKEENIDVSKLEAKESWSRTDGDDGIIYSFMFDYDLEYSYSLMMTAAGEFWDIAGGPIDD